jgi:hypothetical protein
LEVVIETADEEGALTGARADDDEDDDEDSSGMAILLK